jgi:hypothetical protein
MGGTCSTYSNGRVVNCVLVGKRGGKRPLGRPRRRREYNIELGFIKFDGELSELIRLRIETGNGNL